MHCPRNLNGPITAVAFNFSGDSVIIDKLDTLSGTGVNFRGIISDNNNIIAFYYSIILYLSVAIKLERYRETLELYLTIVYK